jgi:hypothetical protein
LTIARDDGIVVVKEQQHDG